MFSLFKKKCACQHVGRISHTDSTVLHGSVQGRIGVLKVASWIKEDPQKWLDVYVSAVIEKMRILEIVQKR